MDKLYLVTRADLDPAQRAVQVAHAFRAFIAEHPTVELRWYQESNHLAFLEVPDERRLQQLAEQAEAKGLPISGFWEPDRQNELTAIALGPVAKRLCRGLPLALQAV